MFYVNIDIGGVLLEDFIYEHHLKIKEDTSCPFKITFSQNHTTDTGTYWHKNIKIFFFTDGSASMQYGSESFDVKADDIVIMNSNTIHRIYNKKNVYYYFLIVDEAFCCENGIDIEKCIFEKKFVDEEAKKLFMDAAENVKKYDKNEVFSNTKARCSVLNLLTYLCTQHLLSYDNVKDTHQFSEKYVKETLKYLNDHFTEKVQLETLASLCGVTKFYLAREFKRFTGQTIFNYITVLRCKMAQNCLLREMSVTETAITCGFDDVSSFSQTYKKTMGVLPGTVKRQIKK